MTTDVPDWSHPTEAVGQPSIDRIESWESFPRPAAARADLIRLGERQIVENALEQLAGDTPGLAGWTAKVRDSAVAAVTARAQRRRDQRPDKVESKSDLRAELVGAADDAEVLDRLASVFLGARDVARGIAGDLLDDLPRRGDKPVRTVKVGDGHGFELAVKVTPRTELAVDFPGIVDVIGTALIARATPHFLAESELESYAVGVRDGIDALCNVLSTNPTLRSTALDALVTDLENRGEDALAKRLRAKYGRVERGDPTVKLERTPLVEKAADQ